MNKFFVFLIIAICVSCSSDNDETDEIPIEERQSVSKIIITNYLLNEPETISHKWYINNRPTADTIYSRSNDLYIYVKYFYTDNRLTHREAINTANQFVEEFDIHYDDLGRIIETDYIGYANTSNTVFTYDGNSIISQNNYNGNITSKTFILDDNGIIFKEIDDSEIIEIEYDADYNTISISRPGIISNFFYDEIRNAPDDFQFLENFMFGDYKNNNILFRNSINYAILSDISNTFKYMLSTTNENRNTSGISVTTFEWVFNSENYPTTRNMYNDLGQLVNKLEYLY